MWTCSSNRPNEMHFASRITAVHDVGTSQSKLYCLGVVKSSSLALPLRVPRHSCVAIEDPYPEVCAVLRRLEKPRSEYSAARVAYRMSGNVAGQNGREQTRVANRRSVC